MAGAARHDDERSNAGLDVLVPEREGESAIEDIERFLAVAVDVGHRPRSLRAGELAEGKGPVRRLG